MELKLIKGIGPKRIEALNENNIYTCEDLISCFPKAYDIYEINHSILYQGERTCIRGRLTASPIFIKYKRNVNTLIMYLDVDGAKLKCVMFSSDYLRYKLFKNTEIVLYGRYKPIEKEFVATNIFLDNFENKIIPDYKLKNIKNSHMSSMVEKAFAFYQELNDDLPCELIKEYKLYDINELYYKSHFPSSKLDCHQVVRRRKYEELFWYSLSLQYLRHIRHEALKKPKLVDMSFIDIFIKSLPYSLTDDQYNAILDIKNDIAKDYPMNRLIQGDVGCGKSIVAYISALMQIKCGYQACIMVPTELLANQQYNALKKLFAPYGLTIELLTSSIKKKEKEDILYRLQNNRVNIIVGTHALIEERVAFYKLGIAIIDEQHRFGVLQRSRLISKFKNVDCLYLTATPIPRTLGLTSFGDLDITSIHTMPKNRQPLITKYCNYDKLDRLCEIIDEHITMGEQVYIVSPLVEENEELDAIDINEAYELFSSRLKNAKIGVVHGKMKSSDKNLIMNDFKNKKYDVLLATTVIEVGVDVKDATIMVILDANRYGLAQMHQLRGRVGRGNLKSCCYLVSRERNERINILEAVSNGFDIAVEDFKLRGPGDYLGNSQSGFNQLSYADFEADYKIWSFAKADGEKYFKIFLEENSNNKTFLSIINSVKSQNDKIN